MIVTTIIPLIAVAMINFLKEPIMFKHAVVLSLALVSVNVFAGGSINPAPQLSATYGTPVASGTADKRIVITPHTKSVNVDDGQVVEFVIDGQRYLWNFQTYNNENVVELGKLIPQGGKVKVYVSRNPLYKPY